MRWDGGLNEKKKEAGAKCKSTKVFTYLKLIHPKWESIARRQVQVKLRERLVKEGYAKEWKWLYTCVCVCVLFHRLSTAITRRKKKISKSVSRYCSKSKSVFFSAFSQNFPDFAPIFPDFYHEIIERKDSSNIAPHRYALITTVRLTFMAFFTITNLLQTTINA